MGTPGSKFQIIQEVLSQANNLLTVSDLCRTAGVSRSGYYNWLHSADAWKKKEAADLEDFQQILDAYRFRGYDKGARGIQMRLLHLTPPLELGFVLKSVEQLVERHGISLSTETLIHSDQGCHYTSYRFIQIVKDAELRQSMSRRGNCWDNAPQESFFGHMKDEIDISGCERFQQVKDIIDDWMDYYNNDRYQWQLVEQQLS